MLTKIVKRILNKFGYSVTKSTNENNSIQRSFAETILGIDNINEKLSFSIKGSDFIENLVKYCGAIVSIEQDKLKIEVQERKYYINSWEELLILNEVFVKGIYNLITFRDFVFIDIGMNVAITSIYMSYKENCKIIYAFEPFEKTLINAKQNIELNKFSSKIKVSSFGLGYPSRYLNVQFDYEFKGSVGINGVAPYIESSNEKDYEVLEIKDVKESLLPILINKDYKEFIKVIKIDCEGAEYEILDRMAHTNLLQYIDIIMLEWHIKGPNSIVDLLGTSGFDILSFDEKFPDIGMVYAFKRVSPI